MPTYAVTEHISAAPDAIWPVLADVLNWHTWTPTVSSVVPIEEPTLRLGSRFRIVQPRLRPAIWTVTAVNPLHSFTWEARTPGLRMVAEHVLTKVDEQQTRLELKFIFSGALGPIIGYMFRNITNSYIATEASKIRSKVEESAAKHRSVV